MSASCGFSLPFSPAGGHEVPPRGGLRPEHQPRQRRGQARPHPRQTEQGPKLPTTAAEARAGASGPQGPGAEEPRRPPATQQNYGFVACQGRPSTRAPTRRPLGQAQHQGPEPPQQNTYFVDVVRLQGADHGYASDHHQGRPGTPQRPLPPTGARGRPGRGPGLSPPLWPSSRLPPALIAAPWARLP